MHTNKSLIYKSTALLLARLEQENNLLATNPKSGIAKTQTVDPRARSKSRPPSIQHLKRLVNGPTPSALRYSMIPAPPMTDLEFYAALVQDYTRTAQCLPTLLSKKIRSGVPPPLRGVVWQSMSGARDRQLEDQFDRLCGESSPYEGIIGEGSWEKFSGRRNVSGSRRRWTAHAWESTEMLQSVRSQDRVLSRAGLSCWPFAYAYGRQASLLCSRPVCSLEKGYILLTSIRLMEHYDLRNCFPPRSVWPTRPNPSIPPTPETTSTGPFQPPRSFADRTRIRFAMVLIILRSYVSVADALSHLRCDLC